MNGHEKKMEKSELKEYIKYLLLGILMYFMIMLFVRRFNINIKEIFGHFLFSIVIFCSFSFSIAICFSNTLISNVGLIV